MSENIRAKHDSEESTESELINKVVNSLLYTKYDIFGTVSQWH